MLAREHGHGGPGIDPLVELNGGSQGFFLIGARHARVGRCIRLSEAEVRVRHYLAEIDRCVGRMPR